MLASRVMYESLSHHSALLIPKIRAVRVIRVGKECSLGIQRIKQISSLSVCLTVGMNGCFSLFMEEFNAGICTSQNVIFEGHNANRTL
jgi:hypothetical protein